MDEQKRLQTLYHLEILDTQPEKVFDGIVEIAAHTFGVPTVLVSLIDKDRQWFKARIGLDVCETARDISFCTHAIKQYDILEVTDATKDERFRDNPLVTDDPKIRYYAGQPLFMPNGSAIGTLCLIDYEPRPALSDGQRNLLQKMGDQVVELIQARHLREVGRISKLVSSTLSDAIILSEADGSISFWNQAAAAIFGWSQVEALGQPLSLILAESSRSELELNMQRANAGRDAELLGRPVEICANRKCGEEFPIELSLVRWQSSDGDDETGYAAVVRDISSRKALQAECERSEAYLAAVIESLPSMLFVKNAKTRKYELLNGAAEVITGRPRTAAIGRTDEELYPDLAATYRARDDQVVSTGKESIFESDFEDAGHNMRRVRIKRVLVEGVDREPFILGIADDVTDRHRAHKKIAHLALHDSLTGLRNRSGIARDFNCLCSGPGDQRIAVLTLDLDRFKTVNDLHGHPVGDELLSRIGEKIMGFLPNHSAAARIGGDEFLVAIAGRNSSDRAARFARSLLESLSQPISIEGQSVHAGISIGVATSEGEKPDFERLCQSADRALYRAKESGRGKFCFFDPSMDEAATLRRLLENDLRIAMENDQFTLDFQPLASLATGAIEGFEALARWHHPERGKIDPETFIAIAEESGLIVELGETLLDMAINEAASWVQPLRVAVNLSPAQFQNNLIEVVDRTLKKHDFDPHRLELEITESFLIRDTTKALKTLNQLQSMGVKIAMDDFGTGYSSLSYLQMFPFDKVKIDRSFVKDMTSNPQSLAIVQAIIGLGKGLSLPVVAEGVETDDQRSALQHEGCSVVQGFGIGRPAPIEQFYGIVVDRQTDQDHKNISAA